MEASSPDTILQPGRGPSGDGFGVRGLDRRDRLILVRGSGTELAIESLVDEGAQPGADVEVPLGAEALEPFRGLEETRIGSATRCNIPIHSNTSSYKKVTKLHAATLIHRERDWTSGGLPARDHCGESDLPARGARGVPTPVPLCTPPCRTSGQKGGVALTTSTPPVRRAVTPGEGGGTRGAASLRFLAADVGSPCFPAAGAAFRESSTPHRRRLRPLRKRRCAYQDHVPLRCPPPRLKGGHPSDGICVTPRGGNRRSFPGHWMRLLLAPFGALS